METMHPTYPQTVTYCRYCHEVVAQRPGEELRVREGLCSKQRCVEAWRHRLLSHRGRRTLGEVA